MSLSPLFTTAVVAFLATVAAEGNAVDQGVQSITTPEDIAHPIYEFVYEVGQSEGGDSGEFGHTESRDGGRTWGSYFQTLPDGRLQTVKYWADESGYHAEVEYSGTARPWTEQEGKGRDQSPRTPDLAALLESFPNESPTTTPKPAHRSSANLIPNTFTDLSQPQVALSEQGRRHQVLQPIPIELYSKRRQGKESLRV